jgi:hypothetical protein
MSVTTEAENALIDQIGMIEKERKAAPESKKNQFIQRKIDLLRALSTLPGIRKENKAKYDGLIAKCLDAIAPVAPVVHVIHPGIVLHPLASMHYIGRPVILAPGVYHDPSVGFILHG